MTYDPRWDAIARAWLIDSCRPARCVRHYTPQLAQRLQDVAEDFETELPDLERDAEDAAEDAHWDHRIDEARGK